MKPWRTLAVPHADVLAGTALQADFAAHISQVAGGVAPAVYQDARLFFERTFITEGMRLLLTQVAERLNGRGGEPVIQLQTAFGGGKTHTMLAVYHLAKRKVALRDLPGIPSLLELAGLMDVPHGQVAVLDGNAHSPGQPWKRVSTEVRTLWGELAWQLGGPEGFERLREADATGTSPGKEVLTALLQSAAPCVVLVDELVAWVRQLPDQPGLSGGTYDTNLSFLHALTEAVSQVPNAVVLASLPESEAEAGSSRGLVALNALEKIFGRVQALWKPVAIEESFEIVRRRLFEPIRDEAGRDAVCAAFVQAYQTEGSRLPAEVQQGGYARRLARAYPFHPEIFDRLYEDWSTLPSFQRTRGVLKLMARVIHRLFRDDNTDLLILPGSLPLYDVNTRNELTVHLSGGWDAVLDKDVDGERSEAVHLDTSEARFGAHHAARRVARTLFFGSAPASVAMRPGTTRGIERGRILLGSLQPGQSGAVFVDALTKLGDRLHYLNASGDRLQDGTRFWFDVRANLRREMEDRKARFNERTDVRNRIAEVVGKLTIGRSHFDGVHIFTPHSDVPDDGALRLVVIEAAYSKQDPRDAEEAVRLWVRQNGQKPRFKANRLVCLAPDVGTLGRLREAVRTSLAWSSIVADIGQGRLNVDRLQADQASKEAATAVDVVMRAGRECYRWLLGPVQHTAGEQTIRVEAFALNTAGPLMPEIDRVCEENELVIPVWSPIHLRTRLRALYWKEGRTAVRALAVWEDLQKYLYLPRLKNRSVFEQAVLSGTAGADFFGTAHGEGDQLEGLQLGGSRLQVDDTLLLVQPEAAREHLAAAETRRQAAAQASTHAPPRDPVTPGRRTPPTGQPVVNPDPVKPGLLGQPELGLPERKATHFFGTAEVSAATAKLKLVTLAEEIIAVLASDPNATVQVTVEISAQHPQGAPEHIRRAVSENAAQLGFKIRDWE
jgi:predicted AAA+ superfamily ATPase